MTDKGKDPEQEIQSKLALAERSRARVHSTESGDDEPITEINVTPLVDVALCMVIIFMAVSPFMLQAGLTVTESKAGAATGKHSLEENVQITLNAEGQILVNDEAVSMEGLSALLKDKIKKSKDGLVTVQADKTNRVGQVVEVMDIAKQSGAKKVAILNKPEEKEAAAPGAGGKK